jgi:hypothetical protein
MHVSLLNNITEDLQSYLFESGGENNDEAMPGSTVSSRIWIGLFGLSPCLTR